MVAVVLTLESTEGVEALLVDTETLPEGLLVEETPTVVFVVTSGNPLIRRALMVK